MVLAVHGATDPPSTGRGRDRFALRVLAVVVGGLVLLLAVWNAVLALG